jgi:hypothetical protein
LEDIMSVDGNWNLTINSPMGARPTSLSLKADGATLTGVQTAEGGSAPIADGKVDGDAVSWSNSVTSPFPMTLEFSGKVVGDTLNGTVKAGSFGSFPFTGARA